MSSRPGSITLGPVTYTRALTPQEFMAQLNEILDKAAKMEEIYKFMNIILPKNSAELEELRQQLEMKATFEPFSMTQKQKNTLTKVKQALANIVKKNAEGHAAANYGLGGARRRSKRTRSKRTRRARSTRRRGSKRSH